ncbi:DUF221-domain-containing protein [Microstroma glucosiphilum]|uniref:DUF221-domain-containing protein n=1 Tax=Pseudomicrostroma glucosiphilum TaxID=1684307 RepID=A0A316UG57_9BASI|nr:DUF221-domain-containing protein [Pseudomicrostroma glucosiphilum]PWN22893.1 DUF221-domain-containing protein [Pseudomicrostroma glucosiphilum]
MAADSDPVGLISDALNSSSQTSTSQVGIATAAYVGIAIVTLFIFCLLRPNNKIVYQPKLKYAEGDKRPPPMSDGLFSWVAPVLRHKEADLLPLVGLDAVTFLRFCRMVRNIITVLAIVMCAVLIPVDVSYNLTTGKSSASKQAGLNILTMADISGAFIWAHVAMSYIGTIIALGFIWHNYRHMVRLRWEWFRSEEYQSHLYARSLMITGVNRQQRSDQALAGLLSSIGMPYPTTDVHISRVVGQLPELIEEHDNTVRQLEKVLAKWLKGKDSVPAARPQMRLGGLCGIGGRKVDAVDYLTKRINLLEEGVNQWRDRIGEKKPESYGFAAMATVPFAHAAAKSLQGKHPRGVTIALAPPPRDILWQNLTLTKFQRAKSSSWGFFILSILLFVNAVPLLAVALISQMSKFTGVLGFLASWQSASQYTFSAVAGLAPPAISGLFGYFLPPLMRKIGKYRGVTTRNKLDRVITSQYFGFLVISQFLIFTLVGVAVTTIAQIVEQVQDDESVDSILGYLSGVVLGTVKYQYLNMANYWLTWVALRLFVITFDMSQALKLILTWIQSAFLGRTPRDIRHFTKPPAFEYSVYYANMLFIFAVGMLYACLAPLVLAFIAVCLWATCFLLKYIHMYVAVTKNESGGRLWRVVVNRLFVCIIFMQLVLALAVALEQHYEAFACLPPVLIVVGFKIYCRRVFDREYDWYIPDANEISKLKAHTGDASHKRLARRFGHPSLHQKLFTPMVHAKIKHLLPKVYQGRLDDVGMQDVDGFKADVEELNGGLKIAAVEEQDCVYDPHLDNDAASIFSSTTVGRPLGGASPGPPSRSGTFDPRFQAQYNNYMAGGPGTRSVEAFEMGQMSFGSQENLLEKTSQAYQGRSGPVGSQQPTRQGSVNTMMTFNNSSNRPSPAAEVPPMIYQHSNQGSMSSLNYFPQPGHTQLAGRQPVVSASDQYAGSAPTYASPQSYSPQMLPQGAAPAAPADRASPGPSLGYVPPPQRMGTGPSPVYYNAPNPSAQRSMYQPGPPRSYAPSQVSGPPSSVGPAPMYTDASEGDASLAAAAMYGDGGAGAQPAYPPARQYTSSPSRQPGYPPHSGNGAGYRPPPQ